MGITDSITVMTDKLHAYMLAMASEQHEVLRGLRAETGRLPNGNWAITPEQAAFLQLLVHVMDARRVIDVGTFTGYSALAMALAMPEDGRIVTCDIAEGWSKMGEHYWRNAGVEGKIDLRIGPGVQVLGEMIAEGGAGGFDLAFLDADKRSYPVYLDQLAELLRPGGLLVADNVLWRARVLDEADADPDTAGVRAFNEKLHGDPRFDTVILPIVDGMSLARKK